MITGNNRGYGNDYHCEFLTKSAYTGNTLDIILLDTSHNNFPIKTHGKINSTTTYKKFGKTSIFVDNGDGGLDIGADVGGYYLNREDFSLDYWFAISNNVGTFNSIVNLNYMENGVSGFTTAFILSDKLPYVPDNHLVLYFEVVGVSRCTGMTYYDLGLISNFTVGQFHHVSFNRVSGDIFIIYDGKMVANGETKLNAGSGAKTTSNLFCSNEALKMFGSITYPTYETYMSLYIDEFRFSKGVRRYKMGDIKFSGGATQHGYTVNNRAYGPYSGGTGSIVYESSSDQKRISAAEEHSLSLFGVKTPILKSWGDDTYGQLGDDMTLAFRYSPVNVHYAVWKSYVDVDCYEGHSIAMDVNQTIWLWGRNDYGQLGNNTTVSKLTPISIAQTVNKVSAGRYHTLILTEAGKAYAWGRGQYGKLGDNTVSDRSVPVSVCIGTKTYSHVSAGHDHSLAIDKDGQAWAWGNNFYGYLGNNSNASQLTPVSVHQGTKTFCAISAGQNFSLSIDNHGQAWGWGYNGYGQLGIGNTTTCRVPVSVHQGGRIFTKISGKFNTSLALDDNGMLWSWGRNNVGQLGNNTTVSKLTPVCISGSKKTFCYISSGNEHSLAVDKDSYSWGWGKKIYLGINWKTCVPALVDGEPKTYCKITTQFQHSLALANGKLWSWGNNEFGELGINSVGTQVSTPISVYQGTKTFCNIIAGRERSFAIDKNGLIWGWGDNYSDQYYCLLGIVGVIASVNTPVSIHGAKKTFCQVSAGIFHNIAIRHNKEIWGWGQNTVGQLSYSGSYRCTPFHIDELSGAYNYIATGFYHSMALDEGGQCWAWGSNNYGELGINSTSNQYSPRAVFQNNYTYCKIYAGGQSSFAIDEFGQIWAWGLNNSGQLGDGTTSSRKIPVLITIAGYYISELSNGGSHTMALTTTGKVFCWGDNDKGQLGDDSTTNRTLPVSVKGKRRTFCHISAGTNFSLAIDNHNRAWSWGIGGIDAMPPTGQNGQIEYYKTPVKINDFI